MAAYLVLAVLLVGSVAFGDGAESFEAALERAREAALAHRYAEVIDTLTPFSSASDPEVRYTATAEIGRAWYHLGAYPAANRAFREAVAIHPDRAETAIYLLATSHLTGDTEQALVVLDALLESGARDLYLAVTLTGTRRFFQDPEIVGLLERHAIPLEVRIDAGSAMTATLRDPREQVLEALGITGDAPGGRSLTAEAGPALIWAFLFDRHERLSEIVLHAQNLLLYTPYRLQFGGGIDWRASPAAAIAAWGPPISSSPSDDGGVEMSWDSEDHLMAVEFARPGAYEPAGRPAGAAMIRLVRFRAHATSAPARIE
jgi:tetratricopeptide (TPR) repeat protein